VRAEARIVVGNPLIGEHRKRIFELALTNGFPSMTKDSRYGMRAACAALYVNALKGRQAQ